MNLSHVTQMRMKPGSSYVVFFPPAYRLRKCLLTIVDSGLVIGDKIKIYLTELS